MVQSWVTTLVLAFGMGVAILGVIAYLKMFGKDSISSSSSSADDVSPPKPIIAADTTGNTVNPFCEQAISEQITQVDK